MAPLVWTYPPRSPPPTIPVFVSLKRNTCLTVRSSDILRELSPPPPLPDIFDLGLFLDPPHLSLWPLRPPCSTVVVTQCTSVSAINLGTTVALATIDGTIWRRLKRQIETVSKVERRGRKRLEFQSAASL
ncbi:hypothetical protein J6590_005311 [Homalodisca vitripennis]|nr:hypothetical protein J6590_005311 [Homalodisca vitripennis]